MNKITSIYFLAICFVFAFGCQNSQKIVEDTKEAEAVENNENSENEKLSKLEFYAKRLKESGSIKSVELNNEKAIISYVKDYQEYKEKNPQSTLTEEYLENYWSSGNAIKKMLCEGPAKIMTKIDYVNHVKIVLPFQGKIYSINVSRSELEEFTGFTLDEIESDWDKKYLDPYVYSAKGRTELFGKFGKEE